MSGTYMKAWLSGAVVAATLLLGACGGGSSGHNAFLGNRAPTSTNAKTTSFTSAQAVASWLDLNCDVLGHAIFASSRGIGGPAAAQWAMSAYLSKTLVDDHLALCNPERKIRARSQFPDQVIIYVFTTPQALHDTLAASDSGMSQYCNAYLNGPGVAVRYLVKDNVVLQLDAGRTTDTDPSDYRDHFDGEYCTLPFAVAPAA